jgi:uncharacterized lipoprotein
MTNAKTWLTRVALVVAVAGALGGCRAIGGGSTACHKPAPYQAAESRPPLEIPPGLEAPDTRGALRIPQLNEPAPPPRDSGPCLDEPPPFAVPRPPRAEG